MNQHKDLLYLQKYATYQFNNRTFSKQNTKISACSLAISYICFQVRIVKKKKRGGEAILSTTTENLVDSRNPQQGLYTRNCNGRNYTSYHSWRPSWRPLFAENSRASRGSAPLGPRQGPYGGPLDPIRMRRATRTDFPAHPFFFANRPQNRPQRRRSWGCWGAVAPPPPIVSSTWKIDNM